LRLAVVGGVLNFKGFMIKSTILKYFEEPLYVVVVWYAGKVYIPCLNLKFGRTEKLFDVLTQYEILGVGKWG